MNDNLDMHKDETKSCHDRKLIIKNQIITLLGNQGLVNVNFVKAEPFTAYANFIQNEHRGYGVKYDIGHDHLNHPLDDSYYNPETSLKGVKTIISFIMPYQLKARHDSKDEQGIFDGGLDDWELKQGSSESQQGLIKAGLSFKISQSSIFRDYHQMFKEKTGPSLAFISENTYGKALAFADTGPLNDRAILLSSGDYRILRSSMLWHRDFGSSFYIGYILTTLDLDGKQPVKIEKISDYLHTFCQTCGICEKFCPNQAIEKPGHLRSQKCVSYLTQTNEWEELEDKTLAGYVYGCDICQMVCPLNAQVGHQEYNYKPVINEKIELSHIESLSNRQFRAKYNQSSAGWIGKKRFIRNIQENMRQYKQSIQ